VLLDKKITLVASKASRTCTESPKFRFVQSVPPTAKVQTMHTCTPWPGDAVGPLVLVQDEEQVTPCLVTVGDPTAAM
jgi:hypothetical protein